MDYFIVIVFEGDIVKNIFDIFFISLAVLAYVIFHYNGAGILQIGG